MLVYFIPASDIANNLDAIQSASVILLTVYALVSGAIAAEPLKKLTDTAVRRTIFSIHILYAIIEYNI